MNTTRWFKTHRAMCKAIEAITEHLDQISDDGAYATVYRLDDPTRVLKVGPYYDKWLLFALYVIEQKTPNPHLPKIYSLTQYRVKGDPEDSMYIAEVEKLYHPQRMGKSYKEHARRLEQHARLAHFLIDEGKMPTRAKWKKVVWDHPYPRWSPSRSFVQATRLIRRVMMNEGLEVDNIDTHYNNLMMRKNTIVLNDPIS